MRRRRTKLHEVVRRNLDDPRLVRSGSSQTNRVVTHLDDALFAHEKGRSVDGTFAGRPLVAGKHHTPRARRKRRASLVCASRQVGRRRRALCSGEKLCAKDRIVRRERGIQRRPQGYRARSERVGEGELGRGNGELPLFVRGEASIVGFSRPIAIVLRRRQARDQHGRDEDPNQALPSDHEHEP